MTFSPAIPSLSTLLQMIAVRRPHRSKSERRWIREYIWPLGVTMDDFGNLIKRIGDAPILWSCHTDTVHRQGGVQRLTVKNEMLSLATGDPSNCLGADCTAGAWLMREMIQAGVPGLYVFHRDEEVGGLGSSWMARHTPEVFDGIQAAIAFDRKGTGSVITHQGERCCSQAFALSLGAALDMAYAPDDTGVFTDTANYTDAVGECTNISVGYYREHSSFECLDLAHIVKLRAALLALDVSKLVYSRRPGEADPDAYARRVHWFDHYKDEFARDQFGGYQLAPRKLTIREIVSQCPDEVADILEQYGLDPEELTSLVLERGAILRT